MKTFFIVAMAITCLAVLAGCSSAPAASAAAPLSTATAAASPGASAGASVYRDGTYQVQCKTDIEGYYVKGTLVVTGGKISSADWTIYDANRNNKVFDKDYEVVFAGNDTYVQQCRDNLKGMAGYSDKLVEAQSLDGVDAVSGATWAYHKFEEFVQDGLKQAAVGK